MNDRAWQHPWLRVERLIRSIGYTRWDKATRPKAKDVQAGDRGAEEDQARGVDELMSARRPDRDPGVSILPKHLRLGDRFTDADTGDAPVGCLGKMDA